MADSLSPGGTGKRRPVEIKKVPKMSGPGPRFRVVSGRQSCENQMLYSNPGLMNEVCEEYIDKCEESGVWPSIPGLKAYLGFSKDSIATYMSGKAREGKPDGKYSNHEVSFKEVYDKTIQVIEAILVQALLSRNAGWGAHKLLMYYHGWKDTQYIEVGRALELLQRQLVEIIERYIDPRHHESIFQYLEAGTEDVEQRLIEDKRRSGMQEVEDGDGRGLGVRVAFDS